MSTAAGKAEETQQPQLNRMWKMQSKMAARNAKWQSAVEEEVERERERKGERGAATVAINTARITVDS